LLFGVALCLSFRGLTWIRAQRSAIAARLKHVARGGHVLQRVTQTDRSALIINGFGRYVFGWATWSAFSFEGRAPPIALDIHFEDG
jgi:hypothetical protein